MVLNFFPEAEIKKIHEKGEITLKGEEVIQMQIDSMNLKRDDFVRVFNFLKNKIEEERNSNEEK